MRARDLGLVLHAGSTGPNNAITDVPGVRVGQVTVREGDRIRSGVTAIWPHAGNLFRERVFAGIDVLNGYGIMTAQAVIHEWGLLGSPVVLTDTRSIGLAYEAVVQHFTQLDEGVGALDVMMPVVAECDDGFLNDNRMVGVRTDHVLEALRSAKEGPVEEGAVGAGTGTQLFGFKGGVGTSSRRVSFGGRTYTVGVLVNTNFGHRTQFQIRGVPVGQLITDLMPEEEWEGSCIGVLATDLPLDALQLRRMAKRIGFGLVRTGSVGNDGSGEIFLAFSTAQRIPRKSDGPLEIARVLEGQFWTLGGAIDDFFDAAADAAEEAVLNAMVAAETTRGRDGHVLHVAPIDRIRTFIKEASQD